jgi:hypothetical protein
MAKSADFDLTIGPWGENTDASQRFPISLKYRVIDTGPPFMVVDASPRAAVGREDDLCADQRSDHAKLPAYAVPPARR